MKQIKSSEDITEKYGKNVGLKSHCIILLNILKNFHSIWIYNFK